MKKLTLCMVFLMALLVGLHIAVPAAIAIGESDDPDAVVSGDVDDDDNEPLAATQDQNAATEASAGSTSNLGTIYVGPSASGEAVRILSTGYTLIDCSPIDPRCSDHAIIVGPADLDTPSIVEQLKAAYEAGHAVALTNATQASIQHLHDLLEHHGSAQPVPGGAMVDLVAFRKAPRPDGQFHFSHHLLFPRAASTTGVLTEKDRKRLKQVSKSVRRKLRKKLVKRRQIQQQHAADTTDLQALNRVFSATPVVPETAPRVGDSPQQNLIDIAESYESHAIQTDSNDNQVQLVNTVWAARSFLNSSDFYYVLQEADFVVNAGKLESWQNSISTVTGGYANVTLLQPSPQTTREATQITSSVSKSIGTSVGFNESQGLDASVSETTTVSNSKTTTVPAISILNGADFGSGDTNWTYNVNDLHTGGALDLFNQWIWQVPFSSYSPSDPAEFFFSGGAFLSAKISRHDRINLEVQLSSSVPWPFGRTFAIQPPVVTGVSPSCVDSGNQFTIQGTGLYPSLVQSVLIGGTPVSPASITTVSDTQISVIAPDTFACHGTGCPVAVQTTQGTSNTNFNIIISDFCD